MFSQPEFSWAVKYLYGPIQMLSQTNCNCKNIISLIIYFLREQVKPLLNVDISKAEAIIKRNLQGMATQKYETIQAVIDDITWFVHHCRSMHSSSKDICKAATGFTKMALEELYNLMLCSQCYQHAWDAPNDCMVKVCQPPHLRRIYLMGRLQKMWHVASQIDATRGKRKCPCALFRGIQKL